MSTIQTQPMKYSQRKNPAYRKEDYRPCPSCGFMTIVGMNGGRDATCKNCGYKEPCCSD